MIDTDKYEGHTEGLWEYDSATIHATAKGGNEIIAEYPCWNYNKDQLITKEEEANLRLMADAPLLLAEVQRLREALINVQRSLIWDEKDRAMDGDPITLEALVAQVEQVRSDITEMIE
jgi:hypothetical protein